MKKIISLIIIAAAMGSIGAHAQTGINTNATAPAATLDIQAKNATGNTVDGLLIPRVDRLRAQSMTAVPTSTLIYVNSIANGSTTGNATNIDAVGYYYYNGALWVKLGVDGNLNIYNSNGTLLGNRTVNQGGFTLGFNGSAVANAFSVDGTTFSVDAANHRVGIGTSSPGESLSVSSAGTSSTVVASFLQAGLPAKSNNYLKFGRAYSLNDEVDLMFYNDAAGSLLNRFDIGFYGAGSPKMSILAGGNVGIGTSAPSTKLHVVTTGTNDPVRFENLQTGTLQGKQLVADNTGVLKLLPGRLIASGAANTFTALGASNAEFQLPLANVLQNTTGGSLIGNVFTVPVTGVYEIDFSADINFTANIPTSTANANDGNGLVSYYMYNTDDGSRLGDKSNGSICSYSHTGNPNPNGGNLVGSARFSCGTKFFISLTANQHVEFRAKTYAALANIVQVRVSFLSIQQIN